MKWIMAIVFSAACVLGIVTIIAQTPKSAEEVAKEQANQLRVTATNWKFDKAEYKVKKGSKLKVVLVNGQGAHGLEIGGGYGVELSGDKLEQEVTFDKAGTFPMQCIVMCGEGHADMKATLIVE